MGGGMGIGSEMAKEAVAATIGIGSTYIHIYGDYFDKVREEFGQDDEIKTFVDSNKELFTVIYTLSMEKGVKATLEATIAYIAACIAKHPIGTTCYKKMNALGSSNTDYTRITDKIMREGSHLFMAAGVIIDD